MTIFLKFGEFGAAKRWSAGYSCEELVIFVASKRAGVTTTNIALTYNLRGAGELILMDDEDMSTRFSLSTRGCSCPIPMQHNSLSSLLCQLFKGFIVLSF